MMVSCPIGFRLGWAGRSTQIGSIAPTASGSPKRWVLLTQT